MKARLLISSGVLAAVLASVGCQTTITTADGAPPVPKPVQPEPAPSTAVANAVAVTFSPKPSDSNGNLYPDTLHITAYLFARPHPTPMFADGSFHFAYYRIGEAGSPSRPGTSPLRTWVFDAAAVDRARSVSLAGPCHEFVLGLLDNGGTDVLPVEAVDLVAWFEPADGGERVWLRGVRSVQFPRPGR